MVHIKKIPPYVFVCSLLYLLPGRSSAQNNQVICFFDKEYNSFSLAPGQIVDLDPGDIAVNYVDSLRRIFGQISRNYIVKRLIQTTAISAVDDALGNLIALDEKFYDNGFFDPEEKKAGVIFILAHEFVHCMNQDAKYSLDNSRYTNYMKELRADERAGYALARLSHVGIHFIEDLLRRKLFASSFSPTHPDVDYRIIAAKAGWTEAITENLPFGTPIKVHDRIFERLQLDDRRIACGEIDPSGHKIGVWKWIWQDKDYLYCFNQNSNAYPGLAVRIDKNAAGLILYMGQQTRDQYEGHGMIFYQDHSWFTGRWLANERISGEFHGADSSVYKGEYSNNMINGQGNCTYKDGSVYSGEWRNGKRNGTGYLIKDNVLIHKGPWQDDVCQGLHCNN